MMMRLESLNHNGSKVCQGFLQLPLPALFSCAFVLVSRFRRRKKKEVCARDNVDVDRRRTLEAVIHGGDW